LSHPAAQHVLVLFIRFVSFDYNRPLTNTYFAYVKIYIDISL
jgi:hypothetical protein